MDADARMDQAGRQVFALLRIGFTAAPILFGIDKFFNWSVEWPTYLAPWVNDMYVAAPAPPTAAIRA